MSLYRTLCAHYYERAMAKAERLCLQQWRREILRQASGAVLEIGAGTGLNLPWYPDHLGRLVLCEPDLSMRRHLLRRCAGQSSPPAEVSAAAAENLPFETASIDTVVSTLVLCSVRDPRMALAEIRRVLKPGGSFLLMEHVAAEPGSVLLRWQRFWRPLWLRCACNCHLDRPTAALIEGAGFRSELQPQMMRGAPAVASPMILGRAFPA